MTTNSDTPVEALRDLGFSEMDARVYAFLVRHGESATGYRISQAVGKPAANVYQAIVSLEGQGAVQVDEGGNRLVRAVPPDELIAGLERRARERWQRARLTLAEVGRETADDRLYSLRETDAVIQRARAMLKRAKRIVLGDLFAGPLALLKDALEGAAGRQVRVVIKTYQEVQLEGVSLVLPKQSGIPLDAWPGQQLTLVADADEHLLALFDRDMGKVHQAVWSRSTFLSCLQHNHVASEILMTACGEETRLPAELRDISLLTSEPGGLKRLQRRFGEAPREDPAMRP